VKTYGFDQYFASYAPCQQPGLLISTSSFSLLVSWSIVAPGRASCRAEISERHGCDESTTTNTAILLCCCTYLALRYPRVQEYFEQSSTGVERGFFPGTSREVGMVLVWLGARKGSEQVDRRMLCIEIPSQLIPEDLYKARIVVEPCAVFLGRWPKHITFR
jgi:hypothetical protein